MHIIEERFYHASTSATGHEGPSPRSRLQRDEDVRRPIKMRHGFQKAGQMPPPICCAIFGSTARAIEVEGTYSSDERQTSLRFYYADYFRCRAAAQVRDGHFRRIRPGLLLS